MTSIILGKVDRWILNSPQSFIYKEFNLNWQKSCWRETLNLLSDADSITIAMKRKKNLMGDLFIFIFWWSTISFFEVVQQFFFSTHLVQISKHSGSQTIHIQDHILHHGLCCLPPRDWKWRHPAPRTLSSPPVSNQLSSCAKYWSLKFQHMPSDKPV